MHKKRLSVIVLSAMILALLCGCCLTHAWLDAACETPRTCTKCGETEGEALGHTWQEATCETPKTCTACGKTEGSAPGHSWTEATCETSKTCTVCGKTDGAPLGHQTPWEPVKDDYTRMSYTCPACGKTEEADLDWAAIAPTLILGTWNADGGKQNGEDITLPDGAALEIRPDGTATLDMVEASFEYTWSYDSVSYPYEIKSLAVVWYKFEHADGGMDYVTAICMQTTDLDGISLRSGDLRIDFK